MYIQKQSFGAKGNQMAKYLVKVNEFIKDF